MTDGFTISDLAAILSLETDERDAHVAFGRHGHSVAVPGPVVERFAPATVLGRHLAYGALFGLRLAIDRAACGFDVAQERPEKPAQVYHHHEIPSIYGDRLPRLVPQLTLEWFEALTGEQPVSTGWIIDGLQFVYILETGKFLHVLCESDLEKMELGRDKLIRDARHALFYDSYKLKPREKERTDGGLIRIFRTAEGVTAGRVMLLPDFDYDAARAHGCFAMPSRDTMVIGRPSSKEHSDEVFERVSEVTVDLLDSEALPLCSHVHRMDTDGVSAGEFAGDDKLPASSEAVSLPDDATIENTRNA
ncbi:hypothetical protein [Persicimonas caeni]|uniref:hypothetical protein n=1 Tax=Persicimonas caeni TaxID=2292766 RepID=UPI00143DCF1E|nr:hypothetical protein [Persicimonas caeni]